MHGESPSAATLAAPVHSSAFKTRRFLNWFPLGLTYAFLYWGRYNLTVAKSALGDLMTKEDFGLIFGAGTVVYAIAFLVNGPLTDRIGGKKAMLIAASGSAIMNLVMGVMLQGILTASDATKPNLTPLYSVLYAVNMYFQSFGAVAIVKVNASWFHVRERGGFSGIFGVMISSGIFFAFDVSDRVLKLAKGAGPGGMDAKWWVFFAPAIALGVMLLVEIFLLKDRPSLAGLSDIDTGDASSGEDDKPVPLKVLLPRILTHPVIFTVALVEFCTGVLRNGVMHWFPIYAKESVANGGLGLASDHLLRQNWGLLLMIAGIIGGMAGGIVSDRFFQSRRAPAAGGLYLLLSVCSIGMIFSLHSPWLLGVLVFLTSVGVIGTHGLLSGTATMDFGGRKGAATAVGMIDGFVYLGTALQSVSLGYLTTASWSYWPPFLVPFGIVGFLLCRRIWHARPQPKTAPAQAPGEGTAATGT
jgi:OPA family glycerol-3-phosphate transporter-like MFS transporter